MTIDIRDAWPADVAAAAHQPARPLWRSVLAVLGLAVCLGVFIAGVVLAFILQSDAGASVVPGRGVTTIAPPPPSWRGVPGGAW